MCLPGYMLESPYRGCHDGEVVAMTTDRYHLGAYAAAVSLMASRLDAEHVTARLNAHDHTLWSADPTEISDRLAWLTLPADVRTEVDDLRRFADAAHAEGYRHVVLLGMGGSSLGPEVIRQVVGSSDGDLRADMFTLDSTVLRGRCYHGQRSTRRTLSRSLVQVRTTTETHWRSTPIFRTSSSNGGA